MVGTEGVRKYSENVPDIVLLDIELPDMSGNEAMEIIKEMDPDAQIIVLTARKKEDDVRPVLH